MTVNDVALALGVTPHTVQAQLRAGRLDGRKVGRDWTISPAAVERYRAASLGRPGRRASVHFYRPGVRTGDALAPCLDCRQRPTAAGFADRHEPSRVGPRCRSLSRRAGRAPIRCAAVNGHAGECVYYSR